MSKMPAPGYESEENFNYVKNKNYGG